jgi:hypothetical protein
VGEIQVSTIRELIDVLTAEAAQLPGGLDTQVAAGVCDGERLQMAWTVGVDHWAQVGEDGARQFVLVRAHPHLDAEPLPALPRGAGDVEEQLRRWE